MTIARPITPVPTEIKSITITLKRWIATDEQPAGESADYQIVLLDQNDNRMRWPHDTGNLVPHLTTQQIAQVQGFVNTMWTLAEGVLPE